MKSKIIKGIIASFFLISLTFLNSCKGNDPDPCENVYCLNNGVCVNGECDCADGYTGSNCENQITPTKIRISEIKITSFPELDNGDPWDDDDSAPDLILVVGQGETEIHVQTDNTRFENAVYTQNYTYTPSSPIELTDALAVYEINLFDYDSDTEWQFVGGVLFHPYTNTNRFPATLIVDTSIDVSFELTLSYIWQY